MLTIFAERRWAESPLSIGALSAMGLALGIFLGFRNNTSYDRFWEGRKLWGALVNTARTLARETLMFLD
jgi:putative membrane protein